MPVPFDDLAAGVERGVIERVRKLAEATAGARNHAPFAQLAAGRESAPPRRPRHVRPEAEHLTGGKDAAVQARRRKAQVLHLAGLQQQLLRSGARIERATRFRDDPGAGRDRLRGGLKRPVRSSIGQ